MSANGVRVRVYFTPPSNPCGEGATCCGPLGMNEEEAETLRAAVAEAAPGVGVELVDASHKLRLPRDASVLRMVTTLGLEVYPVVTVDGEVVSMGPPALDELAELVGARLAARPDSEAESGEDDARARA